MMDTLPNVTFSGGEEIPPSGTITRSALLEPNGKGVSTENAPQNAPHWYVLRATYGREKMAAEYLREHNVEVFLPLCVKEKTIGNKKVRQEVSRLINLFFAFGTEEEIKLFVYDNVNLPYLRFYYERFHGAPQHSKRPMVVPDDQMRSLMIICGASSPNIYVSTENVPAFERGAMVRVVDGDFAGVVGKVARWHGQQRVAITIEGLGTFATAYVPSAFLEPVE